MTTKTKKIIAQETVVLLIFMVFFLLPFFFYSLLSVRLAYVVLGGYPLYLILRLTQWTIKGVRKLKQKKQNTIRRTSAKSVIGTTMITFGGLFSLYFFICAVGSARWTLALSIILVWWLLGSTIILLVGLLIYNLGD